MAAPQPRRIGGYKFPEERPHQLLRVIARPDVEEIFVRQIEDCLCVHEALAPVNGLPGIQEIYVEHQPSSSTVYFDGSCPLCRAEIGYYRRINQSGALCFIDVSEADAAIPAGLTRLRAMERFHVRAGNGQLLSGAAAFAEVWARLPRWRWAARAAALPGVLPMLEFGYRLFLPVRPLVSRFFGRMQKLRAGAAKRG